MRQLQWHTWSNNLAAWCCAEATEQHYSFVQALTGITSHLQFDEHCLVLKHINTFTPAPRKKKQQHNFQPKTRDISSTDIPLKKKIAALKSLKDDKTPGISQEYQEKSSSMKQRHRKVRKILPKVLIIYDVSTHRTVRFCSQNTTFSVAPKYKSQKNSHNLRSNPEIGKACFHAGSPDIDQKTEILKRFFCSATDLMGLM